MTKIYRMEEQDLANCDVLDMISSGVICLYVGDTWNIFIATSCFLS